MRCNQAPAVIPRAADARFVKIGPVPQLASHLFVLSIQAFTVVGVFADSDLVATPGSEFKKPIRVRQRLAGQSDHVRGAGFEQALRLLKVVNPPGDDNRCIKPFVSYFGPDFGG